jgi:Glycosyltransferase family 87
VRRVERLDPNLVLAASAAAVVVVEAAYRTWTSVAWLLLEGLVATIALVHAWRTQERLRLVPVLLVVGGLQLALFGVHIALDVSGDRDSSTVFRWQGNAILHGDYPRSEYPLGAVLLFAAEAWLGGGGTRSANTLVMAPLGMLAAACVWLTRLPHAPWLAAVIGLWPANAFYWQYKFDLAPAAALALGLLLAYRGRWAWAGVALAVGTLVKWTPLLASIALVAWLARRARARAALVHAGVVLAVVVLAHLPFAVWDNDVFAAYERQSGRAITPESIWYLPLRLVGLAHVRTHISFAAGAPQWADVAAGVLQAAAVLALVLLAARAGSPAAAVALAALAPAAFLLTNRIFSPQFMLVLFASWAMAGALLARNRREQLAVGAFAAAAAAANAFVYPFALPRYDLTWPLASAIQFAAGVTLTAALAVRAARLPEQV